MGFVQHETLAFELRGTAGVVLIDYGVNKDPARWGYDLFDLPYDADRSRGCPVVRAQVDFPAEGYAAMLGWIQILDWGGPQQREVIVDRPPQLAGSGIPWAYWGICPSFFDSPSTPHDDFVFSAHAFLGYTPDTALSRVVAPLCGFTWGFEMTNGRCSITPLNLDGLALWTSATPILQRECPTWAFREAPGLDP